MIPCPCHGQDLTFEHKERSQRSLMSHVPFPSLMKLSSATVLRLKYRPPVNFL